MSTEYEVGPAESLPPGQHRVVSVGDRQIGIFNVAGDFYALPNACFHQNGPLCRGRVTGTIFADVESGHKPEWRLEGEIVDLPLALARIPRQDRAVPRLLQPQAARLSGPRARRDADRDALSPGPARQPAPAAISPTPTATITSPAT